ncbi:NAD(P)/FAD-dependent oxidoreductase [Lentzea kentuckyensis]|uniref:NAD(P)/FAD-dependent oxidoreductase n=1 Tax=Lentzea kentuckyensis TaxID=360086 RepID=UPI000A35D830|nr:FAD-dependent monooxygenase [Lentzea kentuckyensis]
MFDCVVVGARVAGAATATLLARRGVRVALLDRDDVCGPTLSTHVFGDWEAFAALGVTHELLEAGAPVITRFRTDVAGCATEGDLAVTPHVLALRRERLDRILLERALAQREVTWFEGHSTTGLTRDSTGRVTGVLIRDPDGRRSELPARVVIGADGRGSTIARQVAAESYVEHPAVRCAYYAYYRGVAPMPIPTFEYFWWGSDVVLVAPCDDDLHCVCVMSPTDEFSLWRQDRTAEFERRLATIDTLAPRLLDARREGRVLGTAKLESYLRTPAGPGWALVGDAGAAVHPCIGAGIDHAVMSAGLLAPAVADALHGDQTWAAAMEAYREARDARILPTLEAALRLARRGPVAGEGLGWLRLLFTLPGATRDLANNAEHVARDVFGEPVAERLRGLVDSLTPVSA